MLKLACRMTASNPRNRAHKPPQYVVHGWTVVHCALEQILLSW